MKYPSVLARSLFLKTTNFIKVNGNNKGSCFLKWTVFFVCFMALLSWVTSPGNCCAQDANAPSVGFLIPKNKNGIDERSLIMGFGLFFKEKSLNSSDHFFSKDYEDTEESLLESLADLLKRPNIKAIVAPIDLKASEQVLQAAPLSDVIIFVPHPSVRFVSGELCRPNIFRLAPNTYVSSQPLARWAFLNLGHKVFIVNEDSTVANEQADFFALGMEKIGGSFGDRVIIPKDTANYEPVFERIKEIKPDFVFAALSSQKAPGFVRAFNDQAIAAKIPLIGVETLTSYREPIESMGKLGLGIKTLSCIKNPLELSKSLASESSEPINLDMAAQGYDIANVLYMGMQKGVFKEGSNEGPVEFVSKISVDGPRGKIQFDANREAVVTMNVGHWESGANGELKRVVDERLEQCKSIDFGCGGVGFPDRPEPVSAEANQGLWEDHQQ